MIIANAVICQRSLSRGLVLIGVAMGIGTSLLVGCSTAPMRQQSKPQQPSGTVALNLTPYTTLGDSRLQAPNISFPGAYTRLLVTGVLDKSTHESNPYDYIDRGALARFFAGQHRTINLSAKVTVGSTRFTATVPLVTVEHGSDSSSGEVFTRVVNESMESYPLFLVDPNGSSENVSVLFEVKATKQYQASASAAIAAVQSVLKTVAPHAAVLTTLTQQSSKDAATALDTTLHALLSTTLDEQQEKDYDIRYSGQASGPTITLSIPAADHEGEWGNPPLYPVGTWTIGFADPRPSIFSDRAICGNSNLNCSVDFKTAAKAVQTELAARPNSAYEVLNFSLVKDAQSIGTVGAYIKQQTFYTNAQKWMNGKTVDAKDVTGFCSSIRDSMVALQLNSFDADIVVWAEANAGNLPQLVTTAMKKSGNQCASF